MKLLPVFEQDQNDSETTTFYRSEDGSWAIGVVEGSGSMENISSAYITKDEFPVTNLHYENNEAFFGTHLLSCLAVYLGYFPESALMVEVEEKLPHHHLFMTPSNSQKFLSELVRDPLCPRQLDLL